MLAAVAAMLVAAGGARGVEGAAGAASSDACSPGLAVGMAAGTAIAYLIELRLRADPNASPVTARTIGTSVNIGALGIGPLVAGCLAAWASQPLTLPYLVWIALGVVALVGLAAAPGDRCAGGKSSSVLGQDSRAAGAATLAAFAANGLFAGLSGLFLATTFNRASHALAGATLFIVFTAGVLSQLLTANLRARAYSPSAPSRCSSVSCSS